MYEIIDGKLKPVRRTFTLTFGDCAENHVGMQKIGKTEERGFSPELLRVWKQKLEKLGAVCELVNLNEYCEEDTEEAAVLIVREGVDFILDPASSEKFFKEQDSLEKDTQAFMYGRVVNKKARHNLCFSEKGQEPDYENKKGRIVSYSEVPVLENFRKSLPKLLGDEVKNLVVEGNYYYDISKCGIGFHGDGERKKVVGVRLGAALPLHYQWYFKGERVGERIKLLLNHGDVYFMSEKATGFDWKKKNITTLRHAAGCESFLK